MKELIEYQNEENKADALRLRTALDNLLGFLDDNNAYDIFSIDPIVRNRYEAVQKEADRAVRDE